MRTKKASIRWFTLLLLFSISVRTGQAQTVAPATLEIMIEDETGALVHHAHVYIFSRNKQEFFGTRDTDGITTFDLPPGDYRVYAAKTIHAAGLIDHYSTPEAFVHLSPEEPTSIILCLKRAEDVELYLTETARQKLGIDAELAKYLN